MTEPKAPPLSLHEVAVEMVRACRTPSAADIAQVFHHCDVVTVSLGGEHIYLDSNHPSLSLEVDYLASRLRQITRQRRAQAMIEASGRDASSRLGWLISATHFVAAWVHHTRTLSQILRQIEGDPSQSDDPLACGRTSIAVEVDGLTMSFRAGVHAGVLTGNIELSQDPRCRYLDQPSPHLFVSGIAVPETIVASLSSTSSDTAPRLLEDVIAHPFFCSARIRYIGIENRADGLAVMLPQQHVTLAPVPRVVMQALPPDVDPGVPWEVTVAELRALRTLSRAGRELAVGIGC